MRLIPECSSFGSGGEVRVEGRKEGREVRKDVWETWKVREGGQRKEGGTK